MAHSFLLPLHAMLIHQVLLFWLQLGNLWCRSLLPLLYYPCNGILPDSIDVFSNTSRRGATSSRSHSWRNSLVVLFRQSLVLTSSAIRVGERQSQQQQPQLEKLSGDRPLTASFLASVNKVTRITRSSFERRRNDPPSREKPWISWLVINYTLLYQYIHTNIGTVYSYSVGCAALCIGTSTLHVCTVRSSASNGAVVLSTRGVSRPMAKKFASQWHQWPFLPWSHHRKTGRMSVL
jgi:hypothetical protein